ncbi:glycosyl hydrolase family 65 protein [Microlunatus panaciterrae]|uniref:Alpha,alpha-trehalose phosphorylase n=1 Tax=Microlunatus panaciterrae TaxID=400768 RepID=A0ABS2RHX1_9ACTN|nr:alpha,alpha-trehalose phosphorylase [Microlunatus panaciterrae]
MRGATDIPPDVGDFLDRTRFPIEEWKLSELTYSPADLGTTETLFAVGNGYLGMRGNVEEGRETYAHGTFINGFHETWPIRHAEEAFGFARVGQTIVNVPDNKTMKLYVDDEPLLLSVADLVSYDRSLDFANGVLSRDIIWRTPAGKRVRVRSERMVSFAQRHLAIMSIEVTMLDDSAPVVVSSQTLNRQDGRDEYHVRAAAMGEGIDPRKAEAFDERVLEPQSHWCADNRIILGYRCANSRMTLAVGTDHEIITDNEYRARISADEDTGKMVFRVQAEQGKPIKIIKTVSYHTSRGVPVRELVDRCRRTLDRTKEHGVAKEFADQRAWLDAFWARSDVRVPGQPAVQQAIRWNLFQIAQATARSEQAGVAAKGVTGSGYGGHYFWDTEIYVLPFLTYTSPKMSRSALRFRYNMLPAAARRAEDLTQQGVLFPWRTISGEEASAFYAAGTAQYHINADISYALCKYVQISGDDDFMNREGIDILVQTARMWADLGFWRSNGDGNFHIHGVTGPDEYTTVVNDNLFTNVMARFNLSRAASAVRTLAVTDQTSYQRMVKRLDLDESEADEWARAAELMAIPFDEATGIHPQDAYFLDRELWDLENTPKEKRPLMLYYHPLVIYRFQVLKQADVVLALFLQGNHFTREQKLANFEYYDPITTGDSTLSAVVQSIIAAEVGYHDLALRYFYSALFVDLANLHGNTPDGVHVASAGGIWNALAFGFGGMRDHGGEVTFDPRLPTSWEELIFKVTLRGTRIRVELRRDSISFTVEEGEHATFAVRDEPVTLKAGSPVTIPLSDQGPRIDGGLQLSAHTVGRRADGSLIKPIVPRSGHPRG